MGPPLATRQLCPNLSKTSSHFEQKIKMNKIFFTLMVVAIAASAEFNFDEHLVVPEDTEVEEEKAIGPTKHFVKGNSKFESAHDRRVDDIDDTTSPWACSLHNSPWFACVPRKGDTTNTHKYMAKSPYGRHTWECSINQSMWYPCKARSQDKKVHKRSTYFAKYPARLKLGKATAQWLKKRNLLKHKQVYFRRKIHNYRPMPMKRRL